MHYVEIIQYSQLSEPMVAAMVAFFEQQLVRQDEWSLERARLKSDMLVGLLLDDKRQILAAALLDLSPQHHLLPDNKHHMPYLWLFAVCRQHRKKGFGKKLLMHIAQHEKVCSAGMLYVKTFRRYRLGMVDLLKSCGGFLYKTTIQDQHSGYSYDNEPSEWWIVPCANCACLDIDVFGAAIQVNESGEISYNRGAEHVCALLENSPPIVRLRNIVNVDEQALANWRMYLHKNSIQGVQVLSLEEFKNKTQEPAKKGVLRAAILAVPPAEFQPCRNLLFDLKYDVVLQEKPLCISEQELLELEGKLSESQCRMVVAVQRQFNPAYQFLKNYINKQRGKDHRQHWSLSAHIALGREVKLGNAWRDDRRSAGGGVLMDMGYHVIDIVQYLFDAPFEPLSSNYWFKDALLTSSCLQDTKADPQSRPSIPETKASLLGRCRNCWVNLEIDREGSKNECLLFENDERFWKFNCTKNSQGQKQWTLRDISQAERPVTIYQYVEAVNGDEMRSSFGILWLEAQGIETHWNLQPRLWQHLQILAINRKACTQADSVAKF